MKCRLFDGEMRSTAERLTQERVMSRFVEFPVEDGGTLLVAVDDAEVRESQQPTYRGSGSREIVERSTRTMEAAVERIRPAARAFVDAFTQLPRPPDEVSVTFGVELSAEAGAIIATTAAKANFSVTLCWNACSGDHRG
jgi:hypothetical protein